MHVQLVNVRSHQQLPCVESYLTPSLMQLLTAVKQLLRQQPTCAADPPQLFGTPFVCLLCSGCILCTVEHAVERALLGRMQVSRPPCCLSADCVGLQGRVCANSYELYAVAGQVRFA